MKQIFVTLLVLFLFGCTKEEVLIADYMDAVPDARFAGTWYGGNRYSGNDSYSFSYTDNVVIRNYISGSNIMFFSFYWRKKKNGSGFECKINSWPNAPKDSKSRDDEGWIDLKLEWIDENTIKMDDIVLTK